MNQAVTSQAPAPPPPAPPVAVAPIAPPAPAPVTDPTGWTPATKKVAVLLTAIALALLGYHAWGLGRWGTRPAALLTSANEIRLDLNQADRVELMQLPGVGETIADRIVEYRDENGPFESIDDLRHVKGVGPVVLAQIRPHVTLDGQPVEESPSTVNVRSGTKKPGKPKAPIDLNRATAAELQQLEGIGPVLAERIVEARTRKPFEKVDDLDRVLGIGPKTLDRVRPHVVVNAPEK